MGYKLPGLLEDLALNESPSEKEGKFFPSLPYIYSVSPQ